ncbi:unnamed protein product [Musa acuminata subsp. malaccensis]|uniref:(wild Malaysian banana) hypothetical protein n=1 Tax=Musa acuminata subsp. malaccensis TaxID=214687 RepID=A0A804JDF2_MUSAM|nr:unnamed protein product [Musa acuminata subsp. malaccensis]
MAAAFRGSAEPSWKQRSEWKTSPERRMVWGEARARATTGRRAAVVYYLSRNGHLEHPHFMEVPVSSSEGLFLRDVVDRLRVLRGPAMAGLYSWSSKRSYKNGYVWHDLSEGDFIHPVHGNEYVLKGTELLHLGIPSSSSSGSQESSASSTSSEKPSETSKCAQDDAAVSSVTKQAVRSSIDVSEYKVYKNHLKAEPTVKSADASTQTEEHRQHRWRVPIGEEKREEKLKTVVTENPAAELSRDEISPPPSSSSPETLEALIKADCRRTAAVGPDDKDRMDGICLSGRVRASAVLMHLISCGFISVKANGLSLMPQDMGRLGRAASMGRIPSSRAIKLEDKEYFSGSLVETDKMVGDGEGGELPSLKRSSSDNADRYALNRKLKLDTDSFMDLNQCDKGNLNSILSWWMQIWLLILFTSWCVTNRGSKMDLGKQVEEDARTRCVPRKPKTRKERKP